MPPQKRRRTRHRQGGSFQKRRRPLVKRWVDRHERKSGEEAPIGLILCADQRRETVELLDLEKSGIRVSSYWTDVLPKEQLQKKLHEAVQLARARLAKEADAASKAPAKKLR
jgi:hypothetical protein